MSERRPGPDLPPKQSDIVIAPDGTICISFLWDDLRSLKDPGSGADLPPPSVPRGRRRRVLNPDVDKREYRTCRLCPKACGFDRLAARHPTCGDHRLRIATAGRSFGDEPELAGESGSGVLMLSGCPLRCPSCCNHEMVADGTVLSLEETVDLAWRLRDEGAHNLQILSPTAHLPALLALARALKDAAFDIPIVFKSSGYERIEWLRRFATLVDVYVPDVKFGPDSAWAGQAGAADYFLVAKRTVAEMIRQVGPLRLDDQGLAVKGVVVRHLCAPLPPAERRAIDAYLETLPQGVRISRPAPFVSLGRPRAA